MLFGETGLEVESEKCQLHCNSTSHSNDPFSLMIILESQFKANGFLFALYQAKLKKNLQVC